MPYWVDKTGGRLLCLLGVWVLVLLLGQGLFAAAPEKAPEPQTTPPVGIILHLSAPETDHDAALGLHLLLLEQLSTLADLRIAPRHEVMDAALKAKLQRRLDHIHLRDIPYLCLKTESQKAIIGWFEVDGETATLALRAHDGVSRAYLGGGNAVAPLWDLPRLLRDARGIIETVVGRTAPLPVEVDTTLNLPALHRLGKYWLASPPPHDAGTILAAWRKESEQDPEGPQKLDALARSETDSPDAALAAAHAWIAAGRPDLANPHVLNALKAGAAPEAWDLLRPDTADDPMRDRIARALPAPSKQPEPRPVLLARARLARAQGDSDAAFALYGEAVARDEDHLPTWLEAGRLALERQDIDKAITWVQRAERLDETNLDARYAMARVYARADFCDRAMPLSQSVYRAAPVIPGTSFRHAEIQKTCRQIDAARQTVAGIFAYNPEHVAALAKLERYHREAGDTQKAAETLERLRVIDPKAVEALTAPPSPAPDEAAPSAPAAARPRPVTLTFPLVRDLLRPVPDTAKLVALVDMDRVATGLGEKLARVFLSPTRLDPTLLEDDLTAALRARGLDVLTDADMAGKITLGTGAALFTPASFSALITERQLDAVVLHRLSHAENDALQVDLYVYLRNGKEVLTTQGLLATDTDLLVAFNAGVLVLPILLLLGVAGFVFWRVHRGAGGLDIAIRYSNTFEDGYFAIRLSKRELDQAFSVDGLMKQTYLGTRSDTEARIRKYFASRSPLKTLAQNKSARLDNVPPGAYFVYIVGIMVNVDTRVPIGSYEVKRQVTIEKNKVAKLEVNLEQTEAYVEVKALRQLVRKRKVVEKIEGKMVEVERDVTYFEEVSGAMIEVNNDPALTKVTIAGEAVGYFLPAGSYRILATYEDLGAAHLLQVSDTSPQQIDLRLVPRREVKLPEMPREAVGRPEFSPALDAPAPAAPRPAPVTPRPGIAPSSKLAPEPIELADDILDGPAPIMLDNSPAVGDGTQVPIDIDDLFTAASEVPVSELMGLGGSPLSETELQESLRRASQMQAAGRFEEAAELFLRAGRLDEAAEMCQRSGNQALNYKIYGISYLRKGHHREAAEMFKYADEPLLEAEALEGLRLVDEANRKRGGYFEQRGDAGRALKHYQKASAFDRIGELHERMQNHEQAGEAFFKARLFDRAGMNFEMADNVKRAAESYEMDGSFEKAADLYRKLGSNVKVFNLLEKSGRHFEAAEGYKKFGLLDEAIHACQQVASHSPDYLRAALIMGKIFIEKGEIQLARSVYFKVVSNADIDPTNIERHYEFGVLIQEQGMIHEAYALFERLQTVRYNYADVTIRLQNLADQVDRERSEFGTAPPPGTIPPFPGYRSATSSLTGTGMEFATPPPSARQTPSSSRYVFERELGRGAMGIVYMARDTALDRAVAYKTVSNAIKDNPASLKYFLSEAKSLAALNHQNVVTVYDVGQESNNYFITMEFVDGRSLGEFIREKGRLSLKNVAVIATKICSGLEYAHSRNVIHRDIKPSNIMISNQGEVKIMDFGLAKIMNDAVQDKTIVRGTPLYMAPEQVEGVGVDQRSDIYSFGVTLFEMATGTLPFTKGDIAYHHLHTPPPSPIRYNPSIPEGLEKIILKCLEKQKESRYQRVADIKRDLGPLRTSVSRG